MRIWSRIWVSSLLVIFGMPSLLSVLVGCGFCTSDIVSHCPPLFNRTSSDTKTFTRGASILHIYILPFTATCVSKHQTPSLRTGGFWWCKVLLLHVLLLATSTFRHQTRHQSSPRQCICTLSIPSSCTGTYTHKHTNPVLFNELPSEQRKYSRLRQVHKKTIFCINGACFYRPYALSVTQIVALKHGIKSFLTVSICSICFVSTVLSYPLTHYSRVWIPQFIYTTCYTNWATRLADICWSCSKYS